MVLAVILTLVAADKGVAARNPDAGQLIGKAVVVDDADVRPGRLRHPYAVAEAVAGDIADDEQVVAPRLGREGGIRALDAAPLRLVEADNRPVGAHRDGVGRQALEVVANNAYPGRSRGSPDADAVAVAVRYLVVLDGPARMVTIEMRNFGCRQVAQRLPDGIAYHLGIVRPGRQVDQGRAGVGAGLRVGH